MNVKEQIARRVKANEEARAILDKADTEKRALTAEERETVRKLDGEIKDLKAKIDEAAQAAEDERALRGLIDADSRDLATTRGRRTVPNLGNPDQPSTEDQELAFRAWCLGRNATPPMVDAARRCGLDHMRTDLDMGSRTRRGEDGREIRTFLPVRANPAQDILGVETRALAEGTTNLGGYAVPNEMMRAYYEVQKWYGRARQLAQVIQTESGATLPWPTIDDTSNTGEILGEGSTAATADPSFGVVNLGAFKFSSKYVYVSQELLQDSFIDIAAYLGTALGRRIGRYQNLKFTLGAGTTEPKGFVIAAAVGKTASATNAFTFDDVIDLVHSLDPAYRGLPDTGFQVHDTIAAYLRKLKDGQGRYIWEISAQLGQPDRLFGFPASINNDMDSALTTGKKLVAFGNMRLAYIVRDAGATRFRRDDSVRVLQDQVVFLAFQRSDGNLVDSTAVKVLALA